MNIRDLKLRVRALLAVRRVELTDHVRKIDEVDGVIQAWAGFRPWHPRGTYASTLELLVYVARRHRGRGLGKALVRRTVAAAASAEFHSMIALRRADDAVAARLLRSTGFFLLGKPLAAFPGFDRLNDVLMYQRMLIADDGR